MRYLLKADGTRLDLAAPVSHSAAARLIGATHTDAVALRHLGHPLHVMIVDDNGWNTEPVEHGRALLLQPTTPRKPINAEATRLYLANCVPGTTHQIAGDVLVVPDDDYADAEEEDDV